MKKFAYRFKKLRLENNMTQTDVVDKFNSIYHTTFNKSTISQYENGKRKPDISILENWAEFFDVSIDYLLGHIDIKKYNLDTPNLTDKEQSMLNDYRLLNVNGKKEKENNIKKIGKRLRDLREEKNITQEELGKILGTSHVTIGRYENGERIPKLDILMDLANYFSVSLDFLLFRSDKKEVSSNTDKSSLNFINERKLPIVEDYNKLNDEGKKEAEKRVKELTSMPFYRADETVTIAAHSNKPIDDEEMSRIHKDLEEMLKW